MDTGCTGGGIPSVEFWNLNDKLVCWVLFPALLRDVMERLEFSSGLIGEFAVVIYAGLIAAFIFALFAGRLAGFDNPRLTSLLQGSARAQHVHCISGRRTRLWGGRTGLSHIDRGVAGAGYQYRDRDIDRDVIAR